MRSALTLCNPNFTVSVAGNYESDCLELQDFAGELRSSLTTLNPNRTVFAAGICEEDCLVPQNIIATTLCPNFTSHDPHCVRGRDL